MIPQLAASIGPKFNRYPAYVQPKLNGVRALYQNGMFVSRDEKLWEPLILQHIRNELGVVSPLLGDTILDGELYVHGWSLQRINGAIAVNRKNLHADTPLVEYHVFDVVHPGRNFSDRWFELRTELHNCELPHVKVVATNHVTDAISMEQHFRFYTSLGYEGIMIRPDGPYIFGNTPHGTRKNSPYLWKHKHWQDDEFLCVGVTEGEGKASIGVGALVCSTKLDIKKFKVGTGLDDETRRSFMLNPPIGKLIKVRYLELTADGIPFNPSFLCVMPQ